MFSLVCTVAAGGLVAAAINSGADSFVRLEPSKNVVAAGDSFSIEVYAVAGEPVNAVDITLSFNDNDVRVQGIDTGESVITLWTEEPVAQNGTVHLSGGTYQRGFEGEHLIAVVNLEAVRSGRADFSADQIEFLAGDGTGGEVATAASDADSTEVYVHDEDEDPANIRAELALDIKTDLSDDGAVTLRDISIFMSAWRSRETIYDFNNDGRMSFRDFSIILADYFFR